MYWYIGNLCILTNTYTITHTTKQVAKKVMFPPCLIEHIPLSHKKDDVHNENARIKQVLKETGHQESVVSKIFKRITNNRSLFQLQQQTQVINIQEEDIRISINLPYGEGTSGKLWRILRSHKIRCTFYIECTLRN